MRFVKHLYLGGYGPAIRTLSETPAPLAEAAAPASSFLALHPGLGVLYAVGEQEQGVLRAFTRDGARLSPLDERPTEGSHPCHLAVHPGGRVLAVANYGDGTVSLHHLAADGRFTGDPIVLTHRGGGPVADRQEGSHAHQTVFHDDVLYVSDLGTDEIRRYTPAGESLDPVRLAPGTGPRHLFFAGGVCFLAGELDARVHAYDAATWELLGSVPASGHDGVNYPSHLEVAGDLVYVANRGPNTVSVFTRSLEPVAEVPAEGDWPRHFALDGDRMFVANQNSGTLAVLTLKDGIPAPAGQSLAAEGVACVLIG
ncbi:lactonase family protein [Nonomuraea sp. NPDC050328]|uniref:lactonase family protein n=1 Tax=Nonomuraea sp. NPDC050328 TaxID=3364361 RepID=UPI00379DC05A